MRSVTQASLANAELDLRRFAPLAHKGYASAQQMDTQQSLVDQDRAAVAADQAVIEQDEISLEDAAITSPITGVAGLRLVDIGNVVQPGDVTGMVTVTQVQPIAVLFTLPQSELPDVQAQINQAAGTPLARRGMVARRQPGTRHRPAHGDQQHRGCDQRDDHAARRVHQ